MSEGDLRRPPRLPMQALSERISALTVGLPGSTVASLVPSDPLPAPGGTGSDPEPPAYAEIDPTTPGLPIVAQVIAGLAVTWTGLDTGSNPYPPGVYAEVHVSTTTGFTPSSSTLKGSLSRPGTFTVTGLTAGTGYFVRLVIVDEAGQTATSAQVGPVTAGFVTATAIGVGTITSDLVSFDATAIGGIQQYVGTATPPTTGAVGSTWVNTGNGSYNVLELVSGTKTWVQRQWSGGGIAPDSISTVQLAAGAVTAENILAQAITTKLVNGEVIRTTTDDTGARVRLSSTEGIEVYSSSGRVFHASPTGTVTITGYQPAGSYLTSSDVGSSGSTVIDGGRITSGTITGRTVQSSSGSNRIVLNNADTLDFYSSGFKRGDIYGVTVSGINGLGITGALDVSSTIFGANLSISGANVDLAGAAGNAGATTADAGFNGNRLRAKTSTQRVKYDIAEVDGTLTDVEPERRSDVVTIDPRDVLNIGVAEFTWIEDDEPTEWRSLGWIADDVAAKFPVAAGLDANGQPFSVNDTPIVAALLAVVRDQQAAITDLTARLEALEA